MYEGRGFFPGPWGPCPYPNWDEANPALTWESPWGTFLSHPGMCFLGEEVHSLFLEGFPFLGTPHPPPQTSHYGDFFAEAGQVPPAFPRPWSQFGVRADSRAF